MESWECILFRKKIFDENFLILMPFWNQNGMITFTTEIVRIKVIVPFWLQKGTKMRKISSNFFFWKVCILSFPNTCLECLYQPWFTFYLRSKFGENCKIGQNRSFLRFFQKPVGYLPDLKNWSRHRKNILRPVLERPGPVLSISNFIFEI